MATAKEEEMMLRQGAEDLSASQDQYLSSEECEVAMTRLFPAPAFHLKGSGWYKDGYGGK